MEKKFLKLGLNLLSLFDTKLKIKLKKLLFFAAILVLTSSCKITSPTFKNLGQWQVSKISGTQVVLSNTAYFYNPNNIDGIKVNGVSLEIQTEGKKLGVVSTNGNGLTIPKLSDFQIPLSITVNLQDLIGNLSDIINVITGKTINLRCIGDVKVGYSVLNKSIRIDQTAPVNIKDIKK